MQMELGLSVIQQSVYMKTSDQNKLLKVLLRLQQWSQKWMGTWAALMGFIDKFPGWRTYFTLTPWAEHRCGFILVFTCTAWKLTKWLQTGHWGSSVWGQKQVGTSIFFHGFTFKFCGLVPQCKCCKTLLGAASAKHSKMHEETPYNGLWKFRSLVYLTRRTWKDHWSLGVKHFLRHEHHYCEWQFYCTKLHCDNINTWSQERCWAFCHKSVEHASDHWAGVSTRL